MHAEINLGGTLQLLVDLKFLAGAFSPLVKAPHEASIAACQQLITEQAVALAQGKREEPDPLAEQLDAWLDSCEVSDILSIKLQRAKLAPAHQTLRRATAQNHTAVATHAACLLIYSASAPLDRAVAVACQQLLQTQLCQVSSPHQGRVSSTEHQQHRERELAGVSRRRPRLGRAGTAQHCPTGYSGRVAARLWSR